MKVGMVAYATKQGLGYLAKSFYDAGIVDEVLLVYHGKRTTYPEWYDNKALPITTLPFPQETAEEFLTRVDLVLFFETAFDWAFLGLCRSRGVKTVCMPMYEWYPVDRKNAFDGYLCPSQLDVEYFPGSPLFQPPVDPSTWKLRITANSFLHNAGNAGFDYHKGTIELLRALPYLKTDLRLTVRCQDPHELRKILAKSRVDTSSPKLTIESEIPYEDLFKEHDVYIAPEKFNGLSLPLQEAYAAGMLVMTTDRNPMNQWLPTGPLIPVERYQKHRIGRGYLPFDKAIVNPKAIASVMDSWYGRDITDYSHQALKWARANSWEAKKEICLALLRNFL